MIGTSLINGGRLALRRAVPLHPPPPGRLAAIDAPPPADPAFPFTGGWLAREPRSAWSFALDRLGLAPGTEVIASAWADPALARAAAAAGVTVAWHPGRPLGGLGPEAFEGLVTERTRAVVVSHQLGIPADLAAWRAWCDARRLLLLEDVGGGVFAASDFRPVGSAGDAAVFDLRRALGAPAALVTLRDRDRHGAPPALPERLLRAADPASAVRRQVIARLLRDALGSGAVVLPETLAGCAPEVLPVRFGDPGRARAALSAAGVEARPILPLAGPAAPGEGPALTALPVHHRLEPGDIERVAAAACAVAARRRPRALSLELVDQPWELREDWGALAEATGNPFGSWLFATTWWRHFGAGRRLRVLAVRRHGRELVGLLPLYEARRAPLRVLRFLGHGEADELGPLCAEDDRSEILAGLRGLLRDRLAGDVLLAERLPVEEGAGTVLGGRPLKREPSPAIALAGRDWDWYLASRPAKVRGNFRRNVRNLEREHDVRYRRTADAAELDGDLATFFALHRARWGQRTTIGAVRERFHHDWASAAFTAGWLRLWFLEVDGRPVAGRYGLQFAGRHFHYQSGRDPGFSRHAVGLQLLGRAIRGAIEEGATESRLLRGDEAWKASWATHDRPLETRAVALSEPGRAAVAAAAAAASSPAREALKAAAA